MADTVAALLLSLMFISGVGRLCCLRARFQKNTNLMLGVTYLRETYLHLRTTPQVRMLSVMIRSDVNRLFVLLRVVTKVGINVVTVEYQNKLLNVFIH